MNQRTSFYQCIESVLHSPLKMGFWVAICLIFTNDCLGQTPLLISPSSLTDAQLNANQLLVKQNYQISPTTLSLNIITLFNSNQIQQSPTITTKLPGDTTTYVFTAKTLEAHPNGDFYWYGT